MNTDIQLGTSFSPEYTEGISNIDPLKVLETITKDLLIKDIRFGLRWNKIDDGKGELSLNYYRKYLDYLLKNDCKICLNIGPIKVFRWPEEHIPTHLEKEFVTELTTDTELAKHSYDYLEKLMEELKNGYGEEITQQTFQIENEGFNRFGHIKMLMSEEHMIKVSQIVKDHFPKSKLMINSAGRTNLRKVVSLFKNVPYASTDLTLGLNFYFRLPQTLPFLQKVDFIKYSYPFDMSIKELHKTQKVLGFDLEISEGQFEHWGIQKSPGNSFEDFEYLMEKSLQFFPKDYGKKLVRLWGTEEFALKIINKQMTNEHEKILSSVKNSQKKF